MGSRGASPIARRRTDPSAERCDPYELVDRAREGALDESSRRRLTMVLRSHRDAALELAWMQLFDEVREPRVDCEEVVTQVVRRVGAAREEHLGQSVEEPRSSTELREAPVGLAHWRGSLRKTPERRDSPSKDSKSSSTDCETTMRRPRPEVDEDALTRRLPALDLDLAALDELDLEVLLGNRAAAADVTVPRVSYAAPAAVASAGPSRGAPRTRPSEPPSRERPPSHGQPARAREAARPGAEASPRRRATERTARWSALGERRDPTPQGMVLPTPSRASRTWVGLAATALLSIALGWLAHAWWSELTVPAPPPTASAPTFVE